MSRFARVRAVLFDLDGTLIDSAPDLGAAADQMRVSRGLAPLPLASYRHMAGSGARGMLAVAFGFGTDHPEYDGLREEFFGHYEARMTQLTRPFDEVDTLLGALEAAGLPWGVVTNKAERFTLPLAAALPLLGGARALVCGDTTPHPKPHPAPLLEAARRLGLEPSDCIYVGDDERDIRAGRAAGMATVAARYGYLGPDADVSAWQADAIIDSPQALLKLLGMP